MKVNGKEIVWEDAPKGYFPVSGVKQHVLWMDEKTGANLALLTAPKGFVLRDWPHHHPNANSLEIGLSGEAEINGARITVSEDSITFAFIPKGKTHGKGEMKVIRDWIQLRYHDGPSTQIKM